MPDAPQSVRVAVVQAAPVLFDREASIEKACGLIAEAQAEGARLVLLPEAFVPAYPRGLGFGMVVGQRSEGGRRLWERYRENAVDVPSTATEKLGEAARAAGAYLAIGVIERDSVSGGTLYCTLLYFGPDGQLLGKHRKLKPTAAERLIWGEGDGSTLFATPTPYGTVGGLICWENYMPLARHALSAWGQQIHVAPTWDHGEPWTSTMRHQAKEGRCVVVGCCQAFHIDDIPDRFAFKKSYLSEVDGWINPGGSVIVDPDGKLLAGPAEKEETILLAEVRPEQLVGPRWQLDIAGHYARPDVFELRVHRQPRPQVTVVEDTEAPEEG